MTASPLPPPPDVKALLREHLLLVIFLAVGLVGVFAADHVRPAVRSVLFVIAVAAGTVWLFRDFPGGPNPPRHRRVDHGADKGIRGATRAPATAAPPPPARPSRG